LLKRKSPPSLGRTSVINLSSLLPVYRSPSRPCDEVKDGGGEQSQRLRG